MVYAFQKMNIILCDAEQAQVAHLSGLTSVSEINAEQKGQEKRFEPVSGDAPLDEEKQ
ncbi:MAG: hypothetical protein IJP92_12610 [Lachnospiraceae bacterium]|nr:hypothetical protein [Lachnospiraceae bacterium]